MKKLHFTMSLALFLMLPPVYGQKQKSIRVPLTPEHWQFPAGAATFVQHRGVPAIQFLSDTGKLELKDVNFSSGTIEFNLEYTALPFAGIYFRRRNDQEAEFVYLRVARAGVRLSTDAVQYCPVLKGVTIWNMLPDDQGHSAIKKGDWNHVKLVVSGRQMLVYINDMDRPALQISRLEGNTDTGGLAFNGNVILADLVISPGETAGLSPAAGFDPTCNDARYLRNWSVTAPVSFPFGKEVGGSDMPGQNANWTTIKAENRGLLNLSRQFGGSKDRRLVWLKATIHADNQQVRKLAMGFCDEVWVFLNGKLAYTDKNLFGQPISKAPDGRCSIENTSFALPLHEGDNEVLIGVSNFFFGWGLIARLDQVDGLSF